jgi:hypothetical protein
MMMDGGAGGCVPASTRSVLLLLDDDDEEEEDGDDGDQASDGAAVDSSSSSPSPTCEGSFSSDDASDGVDKEDDYADHPVDADADADADDVVGRVKTAKANTTMDVTVTILSLHGLVVKMPKKRKKMKGKNGGVAASPSETATIVASVVSQRRGDREFWTHFPSLPVKLDSSPCDDDGPVVVCWPSMLDASSSSSSFRDYGDHRSDKLPSTLTLRLRRPARVKGGGDGDGEEDEGTASGFVVGDDDGDDNDDRPRTSGSGTGDGRPRHGQPYVLQTCTLNLSVLCNNSGGMVPLGTVNVPGPSGGGKEWRW